MKWKNLCADEKVRRLLQDAAPISKWSGQPVSLICAHDGLSFRYQNCYDPHWMEDFHNRDYSRHVWVDISDETIMQTAIDAGFDRDEVEAAYLSRHSERQNAMQQGAEFFATCCAVVAVRNQNLSEQERAAQERKHPYLLDTALAKAAEQELGELLVNHRSAVRMTRDGKLLDSKHRDLATFGNRKGMLAWLWQHGYRNSLDDRQHFFCAVNGS